MIITLLVSIIFKINNKNDKELWIIDGIHSVIMIILIVVCFCLK